MFKRALILFFLTVFASFSLTIQSAPKLELLTQWQKSDEANSASIDHKQWQDILNDYLKTHSSGITRVDYKRLQTTGADELNSYLDSLLDIDPRDYSKKEQFAYWVNLYNAATVVLIIENYPIESITKIKDSILSFGPWDREWIEVGDDILSLNDIEHRILRPIWKDNRIHYAVNCASLSCPNLSNQAFTAENTETLLEKLAVEYVNHPRGTSIIKDRLYVSSIYDWYKDDFGSNNANLIAHLIQYAKPPLKAKLEGLKSQSYKDDYDWQLNDLSQKLDKF